MSQKKISYALRHPKALVRQINSENFKKFLSYSKANGLRASCAHILECAYPESELHRNPTKNERCHEGCEYRLLKYPESTEPLVSIIIPVYNHFELTYGCIESLIKNDENIPTEVIIADDRSTDKTAELEKYIAGTRHIRTERNSGFLLNCNNAAKHAKGKYLFFLNNDTLATPEWLSPLVNLIESDDSIGEVGSKLLFGDGVLQEAGGILWHDESAWNYGRDSDPSCSEFNYVKECDYITGAAMLVRRDLFEKIGGFDERFVPAYCEDSDLAFSIRKMGFKVMYQPKSVIIHFEGRSNGKSTENGLKQYQIENTGKLYEKWKDTLRLENALKERHVFGARDRSLNRQTILFIDETIPMYDDNAGNRTVYDYIKTLVSIGANVKFIPNNFYYDPKYVPIYEQMGVEVLYGPYYANNWQKWISDNGEYIDYVMLFRPSCAEKYMDFIRMHTKAKILYNVCDLHYLRLMREYRVTGDESLLKESKESKKTEYRYMNDADRCITVSTDEKKLMQQIIPPEKVRVYPIFCFDKVDIGERNYSHCRDLMFVGGFSHRPNGDAVTWFSEEIWPTVSAALPDCKFHIIGSKAPKEVLKLESDRIIIEGHVSDERLAELYMQCAVCVIPLRYGAGVKGKTVEALHNKIPIVSTSIGIEGLEGIDSIVTAHDDPKEFAAEVIRLYSDPDLCRSTAGRYVGYLEENFSRKSMENLFRAEFEIKPRTNRISGAPQTETSEFP